MRALLIQERRPQAFEDLRRQVRFVLFSEAGNHDRNLLLQANHGQQVAQIGGTNHHANILGRGETTRQLAKPKKGQCAKYSLTRS